MRSLIIKYTKNPFSLFIVLISFFILFISMWYFLFFIGLSENYQVSKNLENDISKDLNKFRIMQSKIDDMEKDWNEINDNFQKEIKRIPDKKLYEIVNDYLYSSIINYNLKIINFSPSTEPLQKETIFIPESEENIIVEKIPIEISLKGSFINFNQFLEKLINEDYKFNSSDVEVVQSKTSAEQTINLIAYAYFQSFENKVTKKSIKIKKNKTIHSRDKSFSAEESIEKSKNIEQTSIVSDEDFKGIPEMWLEPATEPIETFKVQQKKTKIDSQNAKKDNEIVVDKSDVSKGVKIVENNIKIEETKKQVKNYNILHDLVVLDSKMCKKVKNNLPVYTSKTFSEEDEKVVCYSVINNNTEKSKDIYHIWYMDGQLKAKVRIRIRSGQEMLAISNRKVNDLDKGNWKVEITDVNKMILDTVIFEVV
tara:strand:+ start:17503 stop:18774 length:1272 start_codon:yes stop_codon:yes gene_type:complete